SGSKAAKSSAKKPAADVAKKSSAKSGAQGGASPMFDAGLAASAAANMLLARRKGQDKMQGGNVSIEHVKNELTRSTGAMDALDKSSSGTSRSNLPTDASRGGAGGRQHSGQTNANEASRNSVPRRNAG